MQVVIKLFFSERCSFKCCRCFNNPVNRFFLFCYLLDYTDLHFDSINFALQCINYVISRAAVKIASHAVKRPKRALRIVYIVFFQSFLSVTLQVNASMAVLVLKIVIRKIQIKNLERSALCF